MIISSKVFSPLVELSQDAKEFLWSNGITVDSYGGTTVEIPEYKIAFELRIHIDYVSEEYVSGSISGYFNETHLLTDFFRAKKSDFLDAVFYPFVKRVVNRIREYLILTDSSLNQILNYVALLSKDSIEAKNNHILIILVLRGILYLGDLLNKIYSKLGSK